MKRAIIIILDGIGVGAAADAAAFASVGANSLGNVLAQTKVALPNLGRLGLGNIIPLASVAAVDKPAAAYGRLAPQSSGMDTISGHWEIAGLVLPKPLPTFAEGFPAEIIAAFTQITGRGVLGNCVASGTEIINRLGPAQMTSGQWIVYTSADSVFQVAAHEDIIPLAELYEACSAARELLQGEYAVGRVIARPYLGQPGNFWRTANRRDYALLPPANGLLARASQAGLPVISVGKVDDIFAADSISHKIAAANNAASKAGILQALQEAEQGLIFSNLIDFDALYGHRNDIIGYAQALADFDAWLPQLLSKLKPADLLFITADHGNDPTMPGTDHNRENVPLLVYGAAIKPGNLGLRSSFADLGATIAAYLGLHPLPAGQSFLPQLGINTNQVLR